MSIGDFLRIQRECRDMPFLIRDARAKKLKDQGNKQFSQQSWQAALTSYAHARCYVNYVIEVNKSVPEDPEVGGCRETFLVCTLNIGMTLLKMQRSRDAITELDKVLSINQSCIKALYRRALAKEQLQEWNEATQDLLRAQTLEPMNKEICKKLDELSKAMKLHKEKEKKQFENIFSDTAATERKNLFSTSVKSSVVGCSTAESTPALVENLPLQKPALTEAKQVHGALTSMATASQLSSKSNKCDEIEELTPLKREQDPQTDRFLFKEYQEKMQQDFEANAVDNKNISPVFLLADSSCLFIPHNTLIPRIRESLVKHAGARQSYTASYVGACNGDREDFYDLFLIIMGKLGIMASSCRMICANPALADGDRKFLHQSNICLLAGGDPKRGWDAIKNCHLDADLKTLRYKGCIFIGISAGAMLLGLDSWADPELDDPMVQVLEMSTSQHPLLYII